ncbi:ABC transporter permease [uncultured Cohaesibacter sp.]|uniref:ABC transporter permease n=1 Tax=uncultured Cohaesibacter sp. TaxID=1002546 RepID=UPI00292D0323|nr:ABC transporter permease [uncultured Cohaesibacter sp.]
MKTTTKKASVRRQWYQVLWDNPQSRIGIIILAIFVLVAVFAPWIGHGDPADFAAMPNLPPNAENWLGTDHMGRDVWTRTVWGARNSLMIGFGTALLAITVATIMGTAAGYFRGWVDDLLTLITNLFLVMPGLPLLILLAAYLKPSTGTVVWTLALTGWAFNARVIRAQTMSIREKDFVAASIVSGESGFAIILREIIPNMVNIIVGSFIGIVSYGISTETAMSFLGLTDLESVSWGTNLFWAQNGGALMSGAWWAFVPSGVCVALTIFALSWINYGMDEITNPRLRSERQMAKFTSKLKQSSARVTPVDRSAKPEVE